MTFYILKVGLVTIQEFGMGTTGELWAVAIYGKCGSGDATFFVIVMKRFG